jgi:hypothetical protein
MKYTVSINEAKRSITVTLADGTKGVARCNPSDRFDINTGIELALERAKVAKATKGKESKMKNPTSSIMELVKALEDALPVGQMVVVGNGKELTANQKAWLRSLAGDCDCKCHKADEDEIYDHGYGEGYEDGFADGYAKAEAEYEECDDCKEYSEAVERIVAILDEIGAIN